MDCLGRAFVAGAIVLQVAAFGLTLAVIWSAGVLGEAAIISADDALILFVLNVAGLVGTGGLAMPLWLGGRARRHQARDLATLQSSPSTGSDGSVR